MTKRGLALAAATAAVALPVAGCGEDQSFIDDYNSTSKPLTQLSTDVGGAVSGARGKSDKAIAKEFGALADRTGKVNADLADLEAPDDAAPAFNRLKRSLRSVERDLRNVSTGAAAANSKKVTAAAGELVVHSAAIEKSQSEVKKKVED